MAYNPNFQWNRKTVTISVPTSSLPAGYQVKLIIPKETDMQSDFRDLRFETTNGYGLSHWLESINTTPNPDEATVWVKLKDTVTAPTSVDIYMYYGNPYVSSTSSGINTFDFFDDFEDGNANGWSLNTGSAFAIKTDITKGTYSYGYGAASGRMVTPLLVSAPYILETDLYFSNAADSVVFTTQNDAGTYTTAIDVNSGEYKYWSGAWTSSGIVPTFNNWTTLRIIYKSTTLADFYEGSTLIHANTSISGTPTKISIGAYHTNTRYDNIRLRKYVTTEPATPTIGVTATNINWNPQRKSITINTTSATPINYQIKLTIPFSQEMNIDFSDLRFVTKANPSMSLDYWIESFVPGVTADIWVKLTDAIGISSSDYIYMHYGNKYLTTTSNGANTFDFFDDFLGTSLDTTTKWTVGVGSVSVSNSEASYNAETWLYTKSTFGINTAMRFRYKTSNPSSILIGYGTASGNYALLGDIAASGGTYLITASTNRVAVTGWGTNTYTVREIGRNGSTSVEAYLGSTQEATTTTGIDTSARMVGFYDWVSGSSTIDWVLVCKYVATEPSFSIGTAESMNSFSYRKSLTINNNSGGSLIDYQVLITVAYSSHMQSNFNDIRFIDTNGNLLPYYIESKTDNSTANVWIKLNLPNYGTTPTGDNIVYMYYGNSNLISVSDSKKTFIVYDHFEGNTLNTNIWNISGVGSYSLSNSILTINEPYTGFNISGLSLITPFTGSGTIIEAKYRFTTNISNNKFGVSAGGAGSTLINSSYIFYHDQDFRYFFRYDTAGIATSFGSMAKTTADAVYKLTNDGTNIQWIVDNVLQATGASVSYINGPMYARWVGYATPGYGGSMFIDYVAIRKYTATAPTYITGAEEQSAAPANITATSLVITPSNPCISGSCTVLVDVIWTNTGGTSGTFTPSIKIDTVPVVVSPPLGIVTLGPSETMSQPQRFIITGLTTGIHTICPDPN